MATVYFTKPVTSDLRADVLAYLRDAINSQARLFEGDTLVSPPTNAVRYVASNNRFEKWSGTVWDPLNITGNVTPTPPGGSTNQIQFNAGGGSFGGSSDLTWNGTTKVLQTVVLTANGGASSQNVGRFVSSGSYTDVSISNSSNNPVGVTFYGSNANPASDFAHEFGATPRFVIGRWINYSYLAGGALSIFSSRNVNIGPATSDAGFRLNVEGTGKFSGKLSLAGATTSFASFNVPNGGTVSSPAAGDVWRESEAFKLRTETATRTFWHDGNFDPSTKANLASPAFTGTPTIGGLQVVTWWSAPILGAGTYMWDWWRMRNAADNHTLHFQCTSVGALTIANTPWTLTLMVLDQSGNFTAAGNVTAYSDERLKTGFQPAVVSLQDMESLNSETFVRTDTGHTQVGVRAQALQRILPLAVQTNETGFLSVDYGRAALVLVANLAKEVASLKRMLKGAS